MERPPQSPLATAEPWDLVADAYTAELLPMFEPFAREALRLAALPPAARIVDVATGPGTIALLAAKAGAEVSALDFSAAMIENLRRRAAAAGLRIDARQGDGQALPFDADSYDGAFSAFGLMFFPDRGAGFRELHRVLRPGRRAVVSSWAPMEGPLVIVFDSIRALLPGLPFGQGKGPLSDPEEFKAELAAAGFRDPEIHPVVNELTARTVDDFWGSVQRTTAPVVLLRRKLGEARWAEVAAGVEERLRAALGDGPVVMTARAYLGCGTK